ncbi:hypothetical protein LSH36_40g05026 [Paralvinella palmiformis]|uniref:G-protein coupled receptors family 3 profile domain-containing protein n=1 Tax=Paralvinella palmiformis TaxID=53620 RepID=A0AAD9NGG3_9ANNE|nr:hypothetical protein LSH36_40g05026 [Paralvinella palmiformis]
MTILASLGLVLTLLFLVFNIHYRHRKYIKMSSPNMNNIILTGAMCAFLAMIFGGIDSNLVSTDVHLTMCKFYNWTLSLGFSLAFGAMFSKTWRVHKIFTNKKIQRMVIRDYQLMGIVCILVCLDVTVLAVWEIVDPLLLKFHNKTMEQIPDPVNDNQVLIPQTRFCESPHMWYFVGIIYAIKGLLLVFGAFLAFETRKVTVPALNDSKFIGISVYNVVVLCLIGVPIALVMKEQVDASYALISLFIFFATSMTVCLVFVPKIVHRNRQPHSGTMFTKTSESTASKGRAIVLASNYDVDDNELEKLRTENDQLKTSLDQCQRRLADFERHSHLNGLSPTSPCLSPDSLSPTNPCLPFDGTSPVTVSDIISPFIDADDSIEIDEQDSPLNQEQE